MINMILIVTHAQLQNMDAVLPACLKACSRGNARLVVVYEAHRDHVQAFPTSSLYSVVTTNHDFIGFSAGANRDAGISFVESTYPGDNSYVFIDGDCIPSPDLMRHHSECLNTRIGVITCGSRQNTTATTLLPDKRCASPLLSKRIFTPGNDRVVYDVRDIRAHNVCWSCNLGINSSALKSIRKANQIIVPNTTRVFSSVFDTQWGGEDTLLGLAGFRSQCLMTTLDSDRSYVTHIEHPINHQGTANLKRVSDFDAQLHEHLQASSVFEYNASTVIDTPEFYASLVLLSDNEPLVDNVSACLKLSEHERTCMYFMFGNNPHLIGKTTTPVRVITTQRLQELHRVFRHFVLNYKDALHALESSSHLCA